MKLCKGFHIMIQGYGKPLLAFPVFLSIITAESFDNHYNYLGYHSQAVHDTYEPYTACEDVSHHFGCVHGLAFLFFTKGTASFGV